MIPSTLLYRFSVDCRRAEGEWDLRRGFPLDESFRIPVFSSLDGREPFADLRIAWSAESLIVQLDVTGKTRLPACRQTSVLESEGLQLWIDTRDTHSIHRASRFCHWFVLLPAGGGARGAEPVATMLKINRAREVPKTFGQGKPLLLSATRSDGYSLNALIPGAVLDGWNPTEYRRIGFSYLVVDREKGNQPFSIGHEFPVAEDPSLWQTLELVDEV